MNAGGEGRRALVAAALGAVLGLIAALFARKSASASKKGRKWRGRSGT